MNSVANKTVASAVVSGVPATNGTYSVWSWDKGLYDYYQADEKNRPAYGSEVRPPGMSSSLSGVLGEDPDRSGHRMPIHVKRIGSGAMAMGEIVAAPQAAGRNPWIAVVLAMVIPTALLWLTTRLGSTRQLGDRN